MTLFTAVLRSCWLASPFLIPLAGDVAHILHDQAQREDFPLNLGCSP